MIVSINQPCYLPWLGYFHRIAVSDVHVLLDHVQFEKNSFVNRNKIRTQRGWSWLSVPVKTAGKFGKMPIHELEVANDRDWAEKHWQSIKLSYAKAPHFEEHADFFKNVYSTSWGKLLDLVCEINSYLLKLLEVRTPLHFSSQMKTAGRKSDLVLNLCLELKASVYLSGPLGRNYLHEDDFRRHGIRVKYDDYQHPRYTQAYSGFEPYMSAIDLLFNAGPCRSGLILNQKENVAK
jgi:hypothetical protein